MLNEELILLYYDLRVKFGHVFMKGIFREYQ